MSEQSPTGPPEQRSAAPEMSGPDEDLDISSVQPDRDALEHADSRRDNATGTDAEGGATPGEEIPDFGVTEPGGAMSAEELLEALRRWRVDVVKVRRKDVTWREHHRPRSTGAFGTMHGILNHHTGPFSSVKGMVAMLWEGRSDLPGPLCHVSTAPDGRLFLIGWNGRTNHAGLGARNVDEALVDESKPPQPGKDAVDGNAVLYGNEVMHPGNDRPFPDPQIETMVRFNAAVCEHHGWTANSALMHREWTARKPDMSWLGAKGGARLRAEVARALEAGPKAYHFESKATVKG
jgi:hypothetical protein